MEWVHVGNDDKVVREQQTSDRGGRNLEWATNVVWVALDL